MTEIETAIREDIQAMAANIRMNDGDYVQEGILHCGKCREARQAVVEIFGKPCLVPCTCACQREKARLREAELDAQNRRVKIRRLRTAGLQDRQYTRWTFDADDGRCPKMRLARMYCENWDAHFQRGTGLLLWGGVGTGKTFFAACIANCLLDREVPVLMSNFIQLAYGLRDSKDANGFIRDLDQYDLLIIDDLGAERGTEFMQELVFAIVDARYRSGKPLIVTTNLSLAEMEKPPTRTCARIYDRILERTVSVEMNENKRRAESHRRLMMQARGGGQWPPPLTAQGGQARPH